METRWEQGVIKQRKGIVNNVRTTNCRYFKGQGREGGRKYGTY